MFVLAHVSDTHFNSSERNAERVTRVMAYVNGLEDVDAVLVTGDITDNGLPDEFEEARKVLTSPRQVITCLGNHDVRGPYRDARDPYRTVLLGEDESDGPVNRAHEVGGVIIAACDSAIPGKDEGYLGDETLGWLEGVLVGAGDAPVFVCFHHPPVKLHNSFIDSMKQFGEERLAGLVARYPGVVAFLCGHAHTPAVSTFAGRPLVVAPGVVSTLRLPGDQGRELRYDLPPAIALHVLDDDRRLTTHYRVVP